MHGMCLISLLLDFSKVEVFEIFKAVMLRVNGLDLEIQTIFAQFRAVFKLLLRLAQFNQVTVNVFHPLRLCIVNGEDALIAQAIVHVFDLLDPGFEACNISQVKSWSNACLHVRWIDGSQVVSVIRVEVFW